MDRLSGDYIAGFVDGEGCFAIKFRRDVRHDRKNKPTYFYWGIEFSIVLRGDDRDILESIREAIGCGNISENKRGHVRYQVGNLDDLSNKVIPFFNRYSLHAKKKFDFELWKEALYIFTRNQQTREKGKRGFSKVQWSNDDLQRLVEIQEEMRNYKSAREDWKWIKEVSQNR